MDVLIIFLWFILWRCYYLDYIAMNDRISYE
jgi:hypothetical protein